MRAPSALLFWWFCVNLLLPLSGRSSRILWWFRAHRKVLTNKNQLPDVFFLFSPQYIFCLRAGRRAWARPRDVWSPPITSINSVCWSASHLHLFLRRRGTFSISPTHARLTAFARIIYSWSFLFWLSVCPLEDMYHHQLFFARIFTKRPKTWRVHAPRSLPRTFIISRYLRIVFLFSVTFV